MLYTLHLDYGCSMYAVVVCRSFLWICTNWNKVLLLQMKEGKSDHCMPQKRTSSCRVLPQAVAVGDCLVKTKISASMCALILAHSYLQLWGLNKVVTFRRIPFHELVLPLLGNHMNSWPSCYLSETFHGMPMSCMESSVVLCVSDKLSLCGIWWFCRSWPC